MAMDYDLWWKLFRRFGPPAYVPPSQRGLYGFLTFGADSMGNPAPPGFKHDKDRVAGGFVSLRAGYRFSTNWAVEFMGETATHTIGATCTATNNNCMGGTKGNYQFTSTRIGPAVRLMSNGRKGRFVGTVGLGATVHQIKFDSSIANGRSETAAGSFFQITGSYELNLGHFLLDAGIGLTTETANEEKIGIKNTGSVGLEIRVGYGQW